MKRDIGRAWKRDPATVPKNEPHAIDPRLNRQFRLWLLAEGLSRAEGLEYILTQFFKEDKK